MCHMLLVALSTHSSKLWHCKVRRTEHSIYRSDRCIKEVGIAFCFESGLFVLKRPLNPNQSNLLLLLYVAVGGRPSQPPQAEALIGPVLCMYLHKMFVCVRRAVLVQFILFSLATHCTSQADFSHCGVVRKSITERELLLCLIFFCVLATHFGIALPKWIVEKQNSIWVRHPL